MMTLEKVMKPTANNFAPIERFSLRVQDGVEIYEHEQVSRFQVSAVESVPAAAETLPRLIVVENPNENGLIAKTRSEIAGLAALLSTVLIPR